MINAMNLKRVEIANWHTTYEMTLYYNKGTTQILDLLAEFLIDVTTMVAPVAYAGATF
jgi:hypothetical protein